MSRLLIRGGTVVDQSGKRRVDVAIENGVIAEIAPSLESHNAQVLDASDCYVTPGLVDIHVHLREPGREEAETVESGTRAAALGGCTAVVAMPNTDPVIDSSGVVRQVQKLSERMACDVFPAAAISVGLKGTTLTPMAELSKLGVRYFTDDGKGLQSAAMMRHALEYSRPLGVVIADHCEVESLCEGGHMNEGDVSTVLGVGGIPTEAEEFMVARNIALARKTGGRVHLMHLSSARSVDMVRNAKASGINVTAEVTPHHLTLTDDKLRSFDANFKVNPPLRTDEHVIALREAVADGTIDAIATDHAPHESHLKERPLDKAAFGMTGLETALAVILTELDLPIEKVLALMSWQPARLAGIEGHGLPVDVGNPANLAVIDPNLRWTVDAEQMASQSRNTPFAGRELRGKVRHTLLRGEPVVLDGKAQR